MERFRLEQKVLFRGKCLEGNLLVVLVISQKHSLATLPLVYFQKIKKNSVLRLVYFCTVVTVLILCQSDSVHVC